LLMVTNSHPPWSLVPPLGFYPFHPFLTSQFTLHYLLYIDDINNPGPPRPEQLHSITYLCVRSTGYHLPGFVLVGWFQGKVDLLPAYNQVLYTQVNNTYVTSYLGFQKRFYSTVGDNSILLWVHTSASSKI
jgi:hypothetical protein